MLEESHRGHLKFWFSKFDEVVVVVAVVVAVVAVGVVAVEQEERDGVGDGEEGVACITPPLVGIFLSPAIRPAPPNSSWIIFSSL